VDSSALQDGREALALAGSDPRRAVELASAAARRARRERDVEASAIAEQAWGHAMLYCGDMADAARHFRRSIGFAQRVESSELVGEARMKLAFALAQQGRHHAALTEVDEAVRSLDGIAGARARAYRAMVLRMVSRPAEALVELDSAIAVARAVGDELSVHRMLINRGMVRVDLNTLGAAEADLIEAQRLGERLAEVVNLGLVAENRSVVATLRGDVPAALAHLDHAEQIISAHSALGGIYRDRAALLLSVGLVSEMRPVAEQGIAAFRRQRRQFMVPEMWLLLAEAAYLDQDWTESLRYARLALREFARQRRNDRVQRARLEVLRAQFAAGLRPRLSLPAVQSIVDTMASTESPAVAVEARLVAAELALSRGHGEVGIEHLRQARRQARRGPAVVRARGWYAEALSRLHRGDPRGAARAARNGLSMLTEYSAAMGAADLRAHSAVHRRELARLGLRIALDTGRPRTVFEWAELGRASQLLHPPARPPADAELAALLSQLRATVRELDTSGAAGNEALRRRQTELEHRIRDRSRHRTGRPGVPDAASNGRPVAISVLGAALGAWALVEYVQLNEQLHALTLVDGRLRLRQLGPVAAVVDAIAPLPFALHRLARRGPSPSQAAAHALLERAAARLDAMLLGPLPELDDRPLLVVPTAPLHSLPWSILPTCTGRPVAVSPSATLWHQTNTAPARAYDSVGVAAGPGLSNAREEAHAVAAIHATSPLVDGAATVADVLKLLSTATLMHLGAHGRLHADNPLFSDLQLADGPLMVYDVEDLHSTPRTVVLAACDSGRSAVHTGDELLGLSATLIARGTAQLVAPVLPIPDAETAPLMVALHQRLAAGVTPAEALSAAQRELRDASPTALAAAAGFICLGCG
jgi:tetratricopeptide (TPR) repeat protein